MMIKKLNLTLVLSVLLLAAVSAPLYASSASAELSGRPGAQNVGINTSITTDASIGLNGANVSISQSLDVSVAGSKKRDYYNKVLNGSEQRISAMRQAGIDVSGMETVLAGARSDVVAPLGSALDSGDKDQVSSELKSKCLFNGTSYSYHYGAKMDLEALKATIKKIENVATRAGHGGEITEAKLHISNAESTMLAAGTSPYTAEQKAYINAELKSASLILADVIVSMNAEAAAHTTAQAGIN